MEKNLNTFPQTGTKHSPLALNIVLEVPASEVRQEKEIKDIYTEKANLRPYMQMTLLSR